MYQIAWAETGNIVHVELSQEITIDELKRLNLELVKDYLDNAGHEVHLIVSGGKVTKLPSNVAEISRIFRELPRHPFLGMTVYVELLHPIMAFLTNVVTQIVGQNYRSAKSVPEAVEILHAFALN